MDIGSFFLGWMVGVGLAWWLGSISIKRTKDKLEERFGIEVHDYF